MLVTVVDSAVNTVTFLMQSYKVKCHKSRTKLVVLTCHSCNRQLYFLGPTWVQIPNGISIGSAIFAQLTAECPYTLQQAAPYPSKLPLPMRIWTPM